MSDGKKGAEPPLYRVAVRALCDFTAREGDLDHRFTPSPSAREGMAGHALVVGRRGVGYESEIALSGRYRGLAVSGRADGFDPATNRLEEIKTHRGDLSRMAANQRALHWAQVKVYGALLCAERGLESLTLVLVYLDIASERETLLTRQASAAELTVFFETQCERFLGWAEQEQAHRRARDAALDDLTFPHEGFRPGQRELAEGVYKAAATGRCLLAQAPTGIGKTVATLFPTLKAMPRQGIDRLAFLTMKTPGRRLALEALARLRADAADREARGGGKQRLPLRVLELVARSKACENPDKTCHGDACPLAAGFYDRLPAARRAAVARGWLDREALHEVALEHDICPYYLGQELARWSDVCVGDVNHYFDAAALLHGLAQANGWRLALLVDEAHNLVERARGMYSGELDQRAFSRLHRSAPAPLVKPLGRLIRQWQTLVREQGGADEGQTRQPAYRVLDGLPERLVGALQRVAAAITDYLAEHPGGADPALQERLFEALGFCRLAESFGEHSLCDLTRHGRGHAIVGLRNLVPADFLALRFAQAHSSVLFSATLSPAHYHRDLLGLPQDCVWQSVASPFRADQLEVRIQSGISTRLRDRSASLDPIVAELVGQYRRRPGLYLVFLSSFAYLQAVEERLARLHPELPRWSQTRGMSEAERDAFLARFQPGGAGIGFAVLGGAFGEGIDLPGERLVGAFIATLGLPPFDPFNEALKARLEARFGNGEAYAYRIPGLIKVIQAAGRVIRSPEDRGTLVLMDDRFQRRDVRRLLPEWWQLG
ncbi:ATP-dependent DNA helicase [Billgrantia diversa]|uniref:ATP-dependent DNA helicase n=1 Tax=Halomonas sp. MCCC 1A13316 TaxID=2733487 RepID=UPI0018A5CA66|nr:ATP-dependent DNA helicase [Halomonas sp. MCCC 1A13316]QOR40299.1 ATP-dependent DNA helicase [Halomonas sp. MCCC 1A13316]